ncbi:MAG TPA: histidine kinase dimerization/phosphoacceptor domain -containing protein [Caulobacteraceae bacterium]|nr:histidine kinase dimerization/phosphoacceptor domain -containing protein [Caulobacteraceae bacterium]
MTATADSLSRTAERRSLRRRASTSAWRRFLALFRRLPRDRPLLGLAAGAGFFALASVLRWQLGGMSEGFGPMTFLPAILLAGLYGGIRIGLLVAVVCFLVSWVMFFPPYGTFTLATSHRITMAIFLLTASLELYVIRTLNLAINGLSEARERSNTLFRELQHRVANNLQFVAALLQVRRRTLAADTAGAHALEAAETRLSMMSRVHRRLHDPRSVDQPVEDYLQVLCADLIAASDTPDVRLEVSGEPVILDLEALMSLSLIVAELVTNSLKHAFHDRPEGSICIELSTERGLYCLTVADDGPGLPENFGKSNTGSLGQGILQSLARQLHGKISFEAGPGTVAKLVFQP